MEVQLFNPVPGGSAAGATALLARGKARAGRARTRAATPKTTFAIRLRNLGAMNSSKRVRGCFAHDVKMMDPLVETAGDWRRENAPTVPSDVCNIC